MIEVRWALAALGLRKWWLVEGDVCYGDNDGLGILCILLQTTIFQRNQF